MRLSSVNRSKGTLMVNSTPSAWTAETISSEKKALSACTSMMIPGKAFEDQVAHQPAEVLDAPGVGVAKHAADGGHVGQSLEAQDSLHHGVVAIAARLGQQRRALFRPGHADRPPNRADGGSNESPPPAGGSATNHPGRLPGDLPEAPLYGARHVSNRHAK